MSVFKKLAALLLAPVALCAQDVAPGPTFSTGVTNIHVDAVVTAGGHNIPGLRQDDFVVRDQGATQTILEFREASVPLDLVIVMDADSGELRRNEGYERRVSLAAAAALNRLRPSDRAAVISWRVELPLTSDRDQIQATLKKLSGSSVGGTQNSVGIQWAIWMLEADAKTAGNVPNDRKRAILLVTHDFRIGWEPDDPIIEQLWNMDVALHLIQIRPKRLPPLVFGTLPPRVSNPRHIAEATGGEAIVSKIDSLQQAIPGLFDRIQSSYSMYYRAPQAKPGEQRRITVDLSDAAKQKYPGATIVARQGYIAR